ncbi:1-hydroxy-2-methyl-2-butenyl 4-diphosphate reductase [Streptomyces sp. NBC_01498]|uniref:phosphorylase family protein n=1 Tax=Streptomyces sp. NBC_01498 TaxID=2975870 RepID=UPI002E7BCF25|nr:1-hydroxy-2-methyl-2-butenyl 4-diphosphate reductase [Streptomyces sp. NBC_01498]WTL23660.1 1-hydroxy-2-methyl-2-butenyl 4-diphosphate reductase [Streptomyces sp. NBC_01498]
MGSAPDGAGPAEDEDPAGPPYPGIHPGIHPGGRDDRPGRSAHPAPLPLLIACALGIERLALRGAPRIGRAGQDPTGPVSVLRTGMGPANAERATARALGTDRHRNAAVIASGFCAGLVPGMRPGDLVVADETRDPHGVTPCTGTALLVEALTRALPGRGVHTGPLTGSGHVVRGPERAALRATGAVAVDMESAATLRSALRAGARPVAAVRVVVDAPEHELVRIGTVSGGISAFRVLRAVIPAFLEWHRSLLLPRR